MLSARVEPRRARWLCKSRKKYAWRLICDHCGMALVSHAFSLRQLPAELRWKNATVSINRNEISKIHSRLAGPRRFNPVVHPQRLFGAQLRYSVRLLRHKPIACCAPGQRDKLLNRRRTIGFDPGGPEGGGGAGSRLVRNVDWRGLLRGSRAPEIAQQD